MGMGVVTVDERAIDVKENAANRAHALFSEVDWSNWQANRIGTQKNPSSRLGGLHFLATVKLAIFAPGIALDHLEWISIAVAGGLRGQQASSRPA